MPYFDNEGAKLYLNKNIENSKLKIVDRSSHITNLENQDGVIEEMESFLEKNNL